LSSFLRKKLDISIIHKNPTRFPKVGYSRSTLFFRRILFQWLHFTLFPRFISHTEPLVLSEVEEAEVQLSTLNYTSNDKVCNIHYSHPHEYNPKPVRVALP